ncbi:MAG: amidophosphoribosyltransferase [Prevotellaceae bacterium]|jgi:amidophosphoribosyltransferase|nr:amidophosphoribosyltransferase [Prevotellaceae bacterium]
MSDLVKHECGIAMIRLLKPAKFYAQKYGTEQYGLNKLYLLMEKQHNRGQEAAGVGVINLCAKPGEEYIMRDRALGASAIKEIFERIARQQQAEGYAGTWSGASLFLGHLRYRTTGRSGLSYAHPFLRRNNWPARNLIMAGNFNITNADELFQQLVATGQHPRYYGDTFFLLESLGHHLDREVQFQYDKYRERGLQGAELHKQIEQKLDVSNLLQRTCPQWDGGYVVCGMIGNGDAFVVRDPAGIRPCFYYADDEIVVVASERPVIQTVMNVTVEQVEELQPGQAMVLKRSGIFDFEQVLPPAERRSCSFERIYFSRGSDSDIYRERKKLGEQLTDNVLQMVGYDVDNTVFSFIPNTAEVAFYGLLDGLNCYLNEQKKRMIREGGKLLSSSALDRILSQRIRSEKVALKDIKLRTFIEQDTSRNDMATHVYDVTYGTIHPRTDNLVVIDDSIVRGTTLRQSIIKILDRLEPKKIVVVSSSPQVRYPDCYGIDMASMDELIAFRAAVALLQASGRGGAVQEVYGQCKEQLRLPKSEMTNPVKGIYSPFSDVEISRKIAEMLTPQGVNAQVELVYQTQEGLRKACPNHTGDWYFSGNYPTPGGYKFVCEAFIRYVENNRTIEQENK